MWILRPTDNFKSEVFINVAAYAIFSTMYLAWIFLLFIF